MADNRNSQVPEGNYDPAGSTQMFRAFVEEAAPARQTPTGSRRQRREEGQQAAGFQEGRVARGGHRARARLRRRPVGRPALTAAPARVQLQVAVTFWVSTCMPSGTRQASTHTV